MDDLLRGMLVPPSPRFAGPDGPGVAARPRLDGLRALGDEVARFRPDVIVLASAQWVTTFHTYVAGPARLSGVLAGAGPAPYDFPGDPETARALVAAGMAARIPVVLTEEPAPLDDAAVVPLRDLTGGGRVRLVLTSHCHLADLAETLRWGRAIRSAVQAGGKRTILAVSGVAGCRAPDGAEWGPRPEPELDDRVTGLLASSDLAEVRGSLGELARQADPAPVRRCLALLLGALGSDCRPRPAGRPPGGARRPHPVPD
jgi:Catalytic LigB subunit of aromatic ring-opening dioxygenase